MVKTVYWSCVLLVILEWF